MNEIKYENDPERTISVLHASTDGCGELMFDILASETAHGDLSMEQPIVNEENRR